MSDIRAVADKKGPFYQGSSTTLLLKVTDFDGTPIDPSSLSISIEGPTESGSAIVVLIDDALTLQVTTGFYVYEWDISDSQELGTYDITWEYVVDGETKYEYQEIVVTSSIDDTDRPPMYRGRNIAFRDVLTDYLCCAQSIPVYTEQSKTTRDYQTYSFSFPRWNQSSGIRIYRNQNVVNSGVEVNYFDGTVTFDDELTPQDTVNADYNFRWFSDEQLQNFLWSAVHTVNTYPPHSSYTLENIPDRYIPAVLYGASKDALRQLMMCLQFQQPQQVFGGREAAQQAFQGFQVLKENYEKDWEKLVEQKKFGPYPKTRLVVTPEYTLPGGRSRWFRYLFKG